MSCATVSRKDCPGRPGVAGPEEQRRGKWEMRSDNLQGPDCEGPYGRW